MKELTQEHFNALKACVEVSDGGPFEIIEKAEDAIKIIGQMFPELLIEVFEYKGPLGRFIARVDPNSEMIEFHRLHQGDFVLVGAVPKALLANLPR